MGLAVIAAEDQKFPEHWGFDVAAIEKALAHNERHENRVRGASTLSQQTAKTCFCGMAEAGCEKGWKRADPGHGNGLEQKAHSDRLSQYC
jgi:monofunctional biosynthetic peptidoglycan transglycosylase